MHNIYLYGNGLQVLLDVKVNNNSHHPKIFDMRDMEKP